MRVCMRVRVYEVTLFVLLTVIVVVVVVVKSSPKLRRCSRLLYNCMRCFCKEKKK